MMSKVTNPMTTAHLWHALCIVCVTALLVSMTSVIDTVRYLHWSMPLFATSRVTHESGMTIQQSRGLWYTVTQIRHRNSRYLDFAPVWENNQACTTHAAKTLTLVEREMFERHDPSVLGYDDGIVGVWIAGCQAHRENITVNAITTHVREGRLNPNSLSPERITLHYDSQGIHITAIDNAGVNNNSQDPAKLDALFPKSVQMMWSVMSNHDMQTLL